MFLMERKCVSRRFRIYNPRGVVVPTTAKQERHVKPFDCAQARLGAKYKGVDSRLRGNDNVVVPTTAKQKPWVKPRAKYYGFGISSLGISLRNSPIIFGTIMILVGSAARRRYNHIEALPII